MERERERERERDARGHAPTCLVEHPAQHDLGLLPPNPARRPVRLGRLQEGFRRCSGLCRHRHGGLLRLAVENGLRSVLRVSVLDLPRNGSFILILPQPRRAKAMRNGTAANAEYLFLGQGVG